jgi:hypothetical protein
MNVHLYALLLLIIAGSIQALTCTCYCGSYTYYPVTSCSTSTSCASTCYSTYSSCTYSNTQGCCGTQCIYYSSSSSSYYSSYYSYNQCNCQCSSSATSSATLVGSASMSGCNTTMCQLACNSLYPTTCGVYSNQGYCTNDTNHHRLETYVFFFSMIIILFIFL